MGAVTQIGGVVVVNGRGIVSVSAVRVGAGGASSGKVGAVATAGAGRLAWMRLGGGGTAAGVGRSGNKPGKSGSQVGAWSEPDTAGVILCTIMLPLFWLVDSFTSVRFINNAVVLSLRVGDVVTACVNVTVAVIVVVAVAIVKIMAVAFAVHSTVIVVLDDFPAFVPGPVCIDVPAMPEMSLLEVR